MRPAPADDQLVVTPPTWWTVTGCRLLRTRCIRHRGHRGGCLPIPVREYRRG